MTETTATPTDVISPAEAKFWQEQAERAPALLRKDIKTGHEAMAHRAAAISVAGIGLGVILGVAAFSKNMSKTHKWASGAGATASLGVGFMSALFKERVRGSKDDALAHIEQFAANSQAIKALATHLSNSVTAEDIQRNGLEKAVSMRTVEFMMNPLQVPSPAQAMAMIDSQANTAKIFSR